LKSLEKTQEWKKLKTFLKLLKMGWMDKILVKDAIWKALLRTFSIG
jgi:hypothetical protein